MAKKAETNLNRTKTVLGGETKFNGILRFRDSLKIDGIFEGSIDSPGFLVIEKNASVTADITIGSLVVGGTVIGNVTAEDKVEILPGGNITGNIKCSRFVMADETGFSGKCEMLPENQNIDIFAMPLERLRKSLGRD